MNIPTLTDDELIADLRRRGLVGPIDADFIAEYRLDREFGALLDGRGDIIPAVKRCLQRMGMMPIDADEDAKLIAAWGRYRDGRAAYEASGPDALAEVDAPALARIDAADEVIRLAQPTTIEGVMVKLRRALAATGCMSSNAASTALNHDDDATLSALAETADYEARLIIDALAGLRRLSADPHMAWLAERDALLRRFNGGEGEDDDNPLAIEAGDIERRILSTPAKTRDGILAKALLVVGEAALGDDKPAKLVFTEAKAMGLMEYEA